MNTFQPDQKEIDDVFTKISAMNGKRGCFVNPNEKDAKQLVGALLVNKEKYGFQYCPCRLVLGDKKEKDIHIRQALKGIERAREIITSGEYDLVILDEIISALEVGLIEERDIIDLINIKPKLMHLVITGHNKFPKILKLCDLVTEMKMIKHPYYKGILAQRGIDY